MIRELPKKELVVDVTVSLPTGERVNTSYSQEVMENSTPGEIKEAIYKASRAAQSMFNAPGVSGVKDGS